MTQYWEHVGGGCKLKTTEKYPCDDIYENVDTKEQITFLSTREAHLDRKNFPRFIYDPAKILKKGIILQPTIKA